MFCTRITNIWNECFHPQGCLLPIFFFFLTVSELILIRLFTNCTLITPRRLGRCWAQQVSPLLSTAAEGSCAISISSLTLVPAARQWGRRVTMQNERLHPDALTGSRGGTGLSQDPGPRHTVVYNPPYDILVCFRRRRASWEDLCIRLGWSRRSLAAGSEEYSRRG